MDDGPTALDTDGALAAIRALAGFDDPEARASLVACLDAEPAVAAAASDALAAGGRASRDVCIAALRHPARTRFAALALARIGLDGPASVALWKALPGASPAARVAIAAALHRAPRHAPAALGAWLRDEPDPGVALVVLDVVGRLAPGTLDAGTRAHIASLARSAPSPWLRALAIWAAARHDLDGAIAHAVDLLAGPTIAGPALIAYVTRRGGPLRPLIEGFTLRAGLDPSSELLDGLDPASERLAGRDALGPTGGSHVD